MPPGSQTARASGPDPTLAERFRRVREATVTLCQPLEPEDFVIQSMPDTSPVKWHLAHTSWFFEQFVLGPNASRYRVFHPQFGYLFNSYYEGAGPRHRRPERGLLTRPTVREVFDYRAHVDAAMLQFLTTEAPSVEIAAVLELGMQHEQQHQELILTDLKHLLFCNPMRPAYRPLPASEPAEAPPLHFPTWPDGLYEIGHDGADFCFDNETSRHRVYLNAFELANRLVTNSEYLEFLRDRGYERPELWLSDGWAAARQQSWTRPLYWAESLDSEFTLGGEAALAPNAPVCHVNFYEAEAFARWAGARLPTEAEWEVVASRRPVGGNLLEEARLHPVAATDKTLTQLFGDVWEWTRSAYAPYPGFRPLDGALGEYNGKFMCNQLVLRGGSCATPRSHIRASYRNFLYPQMRWQFSGIRLAREAQQ